MKHDIPGNFPSLPAAAAAAAIALALHAGAAHAGDWRFSLTPYAWLTDVGVEAKLDGRQVVDETIPVGELIEDLDTIFQARFEARNGAFGLMLDLFDVTLSDEQAGLALPQGAGSADLAADVGMTILDLAAVYDPSGDLQGLSFYGGARVLNERATVDATFLPAGGGAVPGRYETDDTLVDALAGVRFTKRFGRAWSWQMQADVSAGGTDYTWSAGPSLGFAFGKLGRYGITAGYRVMTVDFEDEDGLDAQLAMSGLLIGVRTSF